MAGKKKIKKTNVPRDLMAAVLSNDCFRPRVANTEDKKKCQKAKRRAWKTKGEY